jgi:hypothetical protein
MPLRTNVGVNRKVADNNYGSRGASVNLEIELDSSLIQEPERLQERIRQAFRLAQQSVDEELARQTAAGDAPATHGTTANGNGHGNGRYNGNGGGQRNGNNGHGRSRGVTASQMRAIRAIASRQGIDLAQTLQDRFGIAHPDDLSISDASALIDELKGASNGTGGRR